jgi:hypothetical protein
VVPSFSYSQFCFFCERYKSIDFIVISIGKK